jgi:class 3 adenylate cyclase
MDDLKAVMDAVGSEQAAVLGFSEGGNLAALFTATYPERVKGLIMFGTFAKRLWSPDYPWAPTRAEREEAYALVENEWGKEMDLEHYVPSKIDDPEFIARLATYFRRSASPSAAVALLKMNTQLDIRRVLPTIQCPTLVIHRTGDRDVSVEDGRYVAAHIPGARFLELPGEDHLPWVGDQDAILDAIQEFLTGVKPTSDFSRVLTTVLFTDIVGSTELLVEIGDDAWRSKLEQHNQIIRERIRRYRGQEIDTTGDGFLVAFDAPARAISCAQTILASTEAVGLPLRIGIHTGEVHKIGSDMTGITVHIAARVMDKAGQGEICVSESVKSLVPTSSFHFVEMGEFEFCN